MTVRQFLHGFLLLAVAFMVSGTTGDPDLWGHVRFGQDMLAHGAIRLPDTYSFTSDRPWVNHEWLAEILMAVAFNLLGASGLNLLRIGVVGSVLLLVWGSSSALPDRRRLIVLAGCAVGIYLRAHPIRPQMFSLLLFAVVLLLLHRADERRSWRPVAWVPPVMAVWVNLHGGWIVGLGYFEMWCATRVWNGTVADRRMAWIAGVAAALAALVNPYGWHMWGFLADTVRIDRPMIADWQPLHRLAPTLWMPWLTAFLLLAVAAVRSRAPADWTRVAMAAAVGLAAMRVSRLDAFFALAAVFAAIAALAGSSVASEPAAGRRSPALSIAFAVCVIAVAALLVPRVRTIRVPDGLMPDAAVAAYARDHRLTGHVLTWFDWGEYVIWHLGPALKVSMDGRRETVYSPEVFDRHVRFYTNAGQWPYADALAADYVWLPRQLPVVRELKRQGWRALCEGELSILLTKKPDVAACPPQATPALRSFPEL